MKRQYLCLLILWTLLFMHCSSDNEIRFTEIKRPYETITPMIEKLLKNDEKSALEKVKEFWKIAESDGLPVVEVDSLNDEYNYITIAYRDSNENLKVKLNVFGIYADYHLGDRHMYRFEDTDLYYRCYMMPKDICFAYNFLITDTVSGEFRKSIDKFNENRVPTGLKKSYSFSAFDPVKEGLEWNFHCKEKTASRIDTLEYTDKIVKRKHKVYVYLPQDYNENLDYRVIYLFDAFIYRERIEVLNILDNLIASEKIKPMIAVLLSSYRDSRKILLPLNHEFKDEFVNDFLPIIRERYSTSSKPEENIIGGISYGGLAATFIAFYHPEIFGKVLSQSGSFWRDMVLTDEHDNEIRNDWLIDQFVTSEKKNLKVYLDWGLQENMVLGANRRMVRVLDKKGYDYKFIEFNGWHDWANSRKTFVNGLLYLLK